MAGKKQVFYSFHYDEDVFRVNQIRNIGQLEDNKPVSPNDWEELKRKGDASIKKWISEQLEGKGYLVVLIGKETSNRPWVLYEIEKAYSLGKKIIGIYIHNLKSIDGKTSLKGQNPFEKVFTTNAYGHKIPLSALINVYDPAPVFNAAGELSYNKSIENNLEVWLERA